MTQLREWIDEPVRGVLDGVERAEYWDAEWGDRPSQTRAARDRAEIAIEAYSKLIPVFAHRYIPETPAESGNPIFSIMGTDIIIYGANLENYFAHEFEVQAFAFPNPPKFIPGWSKFLLGDPEADEFAAEDP